MKHYVTYVDEGYGHESASCSCGEKWGSMDRGMLAAETALHKCDAEAEGLKKLEAEVARLRSRIVEMSEADERRKLDAEAEVVQLRERLEQQTDWYQQRFNRLRKWLKEEVEPLSKEVAHRYFSICANGSPAPHESADWTDTMHGLRLRAEQMEYRAKEAHDALEAICREFEDTVAHADWRADGSPGMSVPFHGDFATVVQLPSVISRMRAWVRTFKRALGREP